MAQELQQLRPGDVFAGRYKVIGLIRAGGMGAVYEVEDASTRRRRALKLMHPSLVQSADSRMRFQREVFIGAELETEHVVEVLDAGLDAASQVPYLTMELLRGEELGDRLERMKRLSPEETVAVLSQVARALDKAHARGIVHRDLKPENIYLTQREDGSVRAKILDFGIAKLVEGAQTSATQAAGTPLYMAPEQTDKNGHVSPVTDVWALGLVAYRMLTGSSYWQGDSLQQLYRQILMDPITSAVERAAGVGTQLPPAFDHWFAHVVARNPQERYTSAGQAMGELANVFGVSASRPIAIAPPPAPTQRMSGEHTAPPVVNMTPGTPHPSNPYATPGTVAITPAQYQQGMTPQQPLTTPHPGGMTPYPNTYVTPMPSPTPFGPPAHISGTQVAGPEMYGLQGQQHASTTGPSLMHAAPTPSPRKSGNGALIAGVVVGVLAIGSVGAYFALSGKTEAPNPATSTTGKDKDKDKEKPDPKADKPDEKAWLDSVKKLNPFLAVPTKSIELQKHEVTREEFALYLGADKTKKARKPLENFETLSPAAKDGKLPITWVTYEASEAYCSAIGARLPTAEEWDAAVRGPDKRKYPWGNDWPKAGSGDLRDLAVAKGATASPLEVGTSPFDHGPYGHLDLAGNVQEWTSTDSKVGKVLRGCDVGSDDKEFAAPGEAFTEASAPAGAINEAKAGPHLGFRCAKEAK